MLPSYNFDPSLWNQDLSQNVNQVNPNQSGAVPMIPAPLVQAYMSQMGAMMQQILASQQSGTTMQPTASVGMPWGGYSSQNLPTVSSQNVRTIFVGNLAESVTPQLLESVFSKFGTIKQVKLFTQKHFGFITYSTEKEAQWAKVCADQMPLEGREMRISFGKHKLSDEQDMVAQQIPMNIPQIAPPDHVPSLKKDGSGIKTIFIGNLAPTVTTQLLEAVFQQFGTIVSTKLLSDKHYGFVTFQSSEDAETAKKYATGVMIEGRPLRVDFGKM